MLGRGAVEAIAFVIDGNHDKDGKLGCGFLCRAERFMGLVESGHGLDDEEVGSSAGEGADLLGECGAGFFKGGFSEGFETDS